MKVQEARARSKRGLGGQRAFTYIGKSPTFSESVNHKAIHKET